MRATSLTVVNAPPATLRPAGRIARYAPLAAIVFTALTLLLLLLGRERPEVRTLSIVFVSIVLEALPFVLLGAMVGGIIEVYLPREKLSSWLPKNVPLQVLLAAGLGVCFPVCECAVVPVARRLSRKGVPFPATMAYLLAGPMVNPLVAASTFVAYGMAGTSAWRMTALRLGSGYTVAVVVALIMGWLFKKNSALAEGQESQHEHEHTHSHDHSHDHTHSHSHDHREPAGWRVAAGRVAAMLNHAVDDFMLVGQFLVLGAFIAALSTTFIPRQTFIHFTATPVLGVASMMLLAVLLNICSEADAFVAASYRNVGMPVSAQLAFMVLGPMLDLKLTALYLTFLRRRALLVLIVLLLVSVFTLMLGLDALGWAHL